MKEADVRDPVTLRAALNAATIRAELVRSESHARAPSKREAR